jgi:hypothetical protein
VLKYKGSAFKVASFNRWVVVINGPQAVEDIRQAADDELSFAKAAQDVCVVINTCEKTQLTILLQFFALDYTLGPNIESGEYSAQIIRKNLHVMWLISNNRSLSYSHYSEPAHEESRHSLS